MNIASDALLPLLSYCELLRKFFHHRDTEGTEILSMLGEVGKSAKFTTPAKSAHLAIARR